MLLCKNIVNISAYIYFEVNAEGARLSHALPREIVICWRVWLRGFSCGEKSKAHGNLA
jgi:hypothetical protein